MVQPVSVSYTHLDVYKRQDKDMIKGLLAELDENGNTKEGGIQVEGAVMMPAYMKNDEQKAIFKGFSQLSSTKRISLTSVSTPNARSEPR